MIQMVSIKDTRDKIAELVNQVDIAKKQFIITKFGKPKAMLTPVVSFPKQKRKKNGLLAGFGAWKKRKDIKDSAIWVSDLRHRMSNRYGKIFS